MMHVTHLEVKTITFERKGSNNLITAKVVIFAHVIFRASVIFDIFACF